MKSIIIDDEFAGREYLKSSIKTHCKQIDIIGVADDVESGFQIIADLKPDLVFLDIELKSGTGFDLLQKFEEIDFIVIFITAYDKYAINAIKFSCIDYILKPYSYEELTIAVEKAIVSQEEKNISSKMKNLLYNLSQNNHDKRKVGLPSFSGLKFEKLDNIIQLEADGKYTYFHRKLGPPLLISRNIKEYEIILEELGFFRIHRKHIINLNEIVEYNIGERSSVVMTNGMHLPVSRRRKDDFLEKIELDFK